MEEDELLAEIRASGDDPEPALDARPAPPTKRGLPAWLKIVLVFTLLGGGVATLLWGTSASDAFVYSKMVDEVLSEPDQFRGREIRVEGQLQEGSIEFDAEPTCEHRFVLARGGHSMPVRFPRCVVPDMFRDDVEMDVVVQGQLQTDNSFLANQIIPRCPSKYEMRQRRQDGEEMPHGELSLRETT